MHPGGEGGSDFALPHAELAQENLHFAALKESTKEGQAYIAGLVAADVRVNVALMSIDVYTCV